MNATLATFGTTNDYSWTTENIHAEDYAHITRQEVWDWAMQVVTMLGITA